MLKYVETQVTFSEVPEEVTLCINISNCPMKCPECHSKHLWEDIGTELTIEELSKLIEENKGITCIAFMGGDNEPESVGKLSKWVKGETNLKTCWYSGKDYVKHHSHYYSTLNGSDSLPSFLRYFDYVKFGKYDSKYGGLDSPDTNQKFYEITNVNLPTYNIETQKVENKIWFLFTNKNDKFLK